MNYISYSLFGSNPKYLVGALRNAEQVPVFYPDFRAIFYVGRGVPDEIIYELQERGAIIEQRTNRWPSIPLIERHCVVERPDADVVLVRDADSRFSDRESRAVEAWLQSDKLAHVMRDFPFHTQVMMGGMWGIRKPATLEITMSFKRWASDKHFPRWFGVDQQFLAEVVWPQIAHTAMQNDSFQLFSNGRDFPTKPLADGSFVGEIFDEHDKPVQSDRDVCYEARNKLQ